MKHVSYFGLDNWERTVVFSTGTVSNMIQVFELVFGLDSASQAACCRVPEIFLNVVWESEHNAHMLGLTVGIGGRL